MLEYIKARKQPLIMVFSDHHQHQSINNRFPTRLHSLKPNRFQNSLRSFYPTSSTMKFSSFSLAAVAASLASAEYHRCAVESPPAEQITALNEAARLGAAKQEISRVAARNVPVYVHVVSTQAKRSRYTQAQVNNQIAVMNDAYSGMGITFSLKSTDFTVNAQWAAADLGSTAERNMKAALKKGRYSELDLYFASDIPGGTLGW